MENDLSIQVSAPQKGIIFITQMAASIGIGLVASRLFKSFSPAHGAAMGALYGVGASITMMKCLVINELLQKKIEIDRCLEKIEPPYIDALLDEVAAVAKDRTLSYKQKEIISKKLFRLLSSLRDDASKKYFSRGHQIFKSLKNINLLAFQSTELKKLYTRLNQEINYLENKEEQHKKINELETSLKLLDQQLASAGRTMILGVGFAVFLPLLTKRFGFPMNGKILSQFLGAQFGVTVLTNLIGGTLKKKNPLAFFQISSLDQTK